MHRGSRLQLSLSFLRGLGVAWLVGILAFASGCGKCPDGTAPNDNCVCKDGSVVESCVPSGTDPTVPAGTSLECSGMNRMLKGTISSNTTWRRGSICVFAGDVRVAKGAALTIEQDVIVKSGATYAGGLYPLVVEGTLVVDGSEQEPVIFTDIGDDGHGGDTNDDEGARKPARGSWAGIQLEGGASATIRFAEVHYAHVGIRTDGAAPTLERVRIRNCGTAVSSLPTDEVTVTDVAVEANGLNGLARRSGHVDEDTSWNQSGLVHVLAGDVTVAEGSALEIERGVIVKSGATYAGGLYPLIVEGTLAVNGVAEAPVIFTDLGDDGHGGDTNGDEGQRKPSRGSWGGVRFSGSRAGGHMAFSEVHFATTGISATSCSPVIANTRLEQNSVGFAASGAGAQPTIRDSAFIENAAGATAMAGAAINAANNWWGATNGPGGAGPGMGESVTAGVTFEPFLTQAR